MRRRQRRSAAARLALILAALAALIVGYYAGQSWQRRALAGLAAQLYQEGSPIAIPATLGIADDRGNWRLFISVDTREDACRDLLQRYALTVNRLAGRPQIQARIRVTAMAFDTPDEAARERFAQAAPWLDVLTGPAVDLDRLARELRHPPPATGWCREAAGDAVLVAPDHTAWALIPTGRPAIMAHDIATIIDFVE